MNQYNYNLLVEKASEKNEIEGVVSDINKYEIDDFTKEAEHVARIHDFEGLTQSKLYICAKLKLSPNEAKEMVGVNEKELNQYALMVLNKLN